MTINTLQNRINQQLQFYLPPATPPAVRLHEAMHYAVFNGGKRIRPLLVYATGLCFQTPLAALDTAAVAIELIHCYSLVHDDLPAMDDDDYRRGKLSCHKKFDEATAILVGDALQSLAFDILAKPTTHLSPAQQVNMLQVLAQAAGSYGMAAGQQLDMEFKNKTPSFAEMEKIHQLKTGALFQACIQLGTIASSCEMPEEIERLNQIGELIGLAFQWQDDHLDQPELSTTKKRINDLFTQTYDVLNSLTIDQQPLLTVCQYLQNRKI